MESILLWLQSNAEITKHQLLIIGGLLIGSWVITGMVLWHFYKYMMWRIQNDKAG